MDFAYWPAASWWPSFGQEAEKKKREAAFAGYQVTAELMARADSKALFLTLGRDIASFGGAMAAAGLAGAEARARVASARAQLAKTTIRAEVAGTVLTRNAEPGDLVQPGRVLTPQTPHRKDQPESERGHNSTGRGKNEFVAPYQLIQHVEAAGVDVGLGRIDELHQARAAVGFVDEALAVNVDQQRGQLLEAAAAPAHVQAVVRRRQGPK